MLPLHVATIHQPSSAVTRALLDAFPAAARECDAEGRLPPHSNPNPNPNLNPNPNPNPNPYPNPSNNPHANPS